MNLAINNDALRQRSDYTYKFNANTGRHGWLRLTPAYSLKIVEELIATHDQSRRIYDPFCGTGTTALTAAYYGHDAITTDINPFLLWLANAKTAKYSDKCIASAIKASDSVVQMVRNKSVKPIKPPVIHNIERWWDSQTLEFLCMLRSAIMSVTESNSKEQTLLTIAFCRTLIKLSNASFNHQSMSFKKDIQLVINLNVNMIEEFTTNMRFVINGASVNPVGVAQVLFGDSRDIEAIIHEPVDLVITSPPYANRMSYIRELRPYMYWLGFLSNGRDAGELDWTAIGGTWGIATSRLVGWERAKGHFESPNLSVVLETIAHFDNKNGAVLANYVAKYFDDMWGHFKGLPAILAPGAEVHYIVGNSAFYGTLVSTEKLYADMMREVGFKSVECKAIRKRNSKKELVEYDVVGKM